MNLKLLDSRAVRVVLLWLGATLALKALAALVIYSGISPTAVADVQAQLAQLQSDSWKLVMALIVKWGAEDFAKWIPVPPPVLPSNVAAGDITVNTPAAPPPPVSPQITGLPSSRL